MNENDEKQLAGLFGDVVDGKVAADGGGFSGGADFQEAVETLNMLRRDFDAPELGSGFDRNLRARLVSEAGRGRRVIALYRRPWFKFGLAAALIAIVIAPSWLYINQNDVREIAEKLVRLEEYDKKYVSKLSRLKKELSEDSDKRTSQAYFNKRRDERIMEIRNRWQDRYQAKRKETGSKGDDMQ